MRKSKPISVEERNNSNFLPEELNQGGQSVAELEAWRAQTAKTLTFDQSVAATGLTDEQVNRLVHELRGRS
ncbi:hypothetical protein ACOBR2_07920 [Telmatobacter bradus]|uniref:hypothetical protein n=1 Tax=Telmatobacter bradus TaxID=474953 RepID=UPI003B42AC69